ncbi:MAG: hypothetical protein LN573_05770 [Rickettsia endosymbiont of Oxypoda opaca]|nr:hypothetical protein [Rickettsia endosymbiont of Oxypoda opaca]
MQQKNRQIKDLPDALKILKQEIYKKEANNLNKNINTNNDKQTSVQIKCSIKKEQTTSNEPSLSNVSDKPIEASIEATHEIAATVDDLNKLAELKERLAEQEEKLKLIIMNYMHLHSKLTFSDKRIATWKSHNRNNFDLKTFKIDFPDMYELYIKGAISRIFRVC